MALIQLKLNFLLFLALLSFFIACKSQTVTLAASRGCQECATNNNCEHAFRNLPGQFCGHWISYGVPLPCCCPLDAYCKVDNYSCKCRSMKRYRNPQNRHRRSHSNSIPWWFIGLILFALCGLCCWMSSRNNEDEYTPIAQPVSSYPGQYSQQGYSYPSQYPQQQYPQQPYPPQQQPLYVSQAGCSDAHDNGYGAQGAVAAGLAGVVAGGLIGSALANRHHTNDSSRYYEGDFNGDDSMYNGDSGGGDAADGGDFGGDF